MSVKLLTEHNLECLSLKGGCTGSSESTLVKMPHCWKSHVTGQLYLLKTFMSMINTTSESLKARQNYMSMCFSILVL